MKDLFRQKINNEWKIPDRFSVSKTARSVRSRGRREKRKHIVTGRRLSRQRQRRPTCVHITTYARAWRWGSNGARAILLSAQEPFRVRRQSRVWMVLGRWGIILFEFLVIFIYINQLTFLHRLMYWNAKASQIFADLCPVFEHDGAKRLTSKNFWINTK